MKTIVLKTDKKTGTCEAHSTLTGAVSAYAQLAYQTIANAMTPKGIFSKGFYENDDVIFERLLINRTGEQKRKAVHPFRKK